MNYIDYFKKFNNNDNEEVIQFINNQNAIEYLIENAPRLYCPDKVIEETFAFRTWTIRKHIQKTQDGFLLSEFLTSDQLSWAGKHNTINAALTHHLNEFRYMKNSNILLDYILFFIKGEGDTFAYHTPALSAMYNYCMMNANEQFLIYNVLDFEKYFCTWEENHLTKNGLYWSKDDREGTEFTISGTTPEKVCLPGFRTLFNSCMYADAISLSKIFEMVGCEDKRKYYYDKAQSIKKNVEEKMWDGDFFKSIHPFNQDLDRQIDFNDIENDLNVRELMGYIPWAFNLPSKGKEKCFSYLKDSSVFNAKTGLSTADISHPRFMYYPERTCAWNGDVWPYATSYVINAVIELLNNYQQDVISQNDLYDFIKTYANMHYLIEDGKKINFIDEVMMPFKHVWKVRYMAQNGHKISGGANRGRDYNHSTFIDLVLRGLCGVDINSTTLNVNPKIKGIWKWFKIENLTYRNKTYTVYYDENGDIFNKGKGVIIELI